MRKSLIQAAKVIAFLAAGILLLWIAFRTVDFESLRESLIGASYEWLIVSVLFGLIAYLSRARRWVILINPLGHNPGFWNTFHSMMTGYLANLVLPRIGEITRCVTLGKKENIPVDQLIGTVVLERTIDLLSIIVITFGVFFTSGSKIREYLNEAVMNPLREKVISAFGSASVLWGILIFLSVLSLFLLFRYKKKLRKTRFFSKIFNIARGVVNGFQTILKLKRGWEFVFHTLLIWFSYAMMTWLSSSASKALHIFPSATLFILVIGSIAMSAPVQGGMGAFHYFVPRGIAFVEGVSIEDASAYAILTHESQLLLGLLLGGLAFWMLSRKKPKEINNG
ncbi:MAG: flippase-like domain-containing protein [Bacteroidales bacterium]|nr:flippase-like domain-containing protein [Bacteroidales bacterium]